MTTTVVSPDDVKDGARTIRQRCVALRALLDRLQYHSESSPAGLTDAQALDALGTHVEHALPVMTDLLDSIESNCDLIEVSS